MHITCSRCGKEVMDAENASSSSPAAATTTASSSSSSSSPFASSSSYPSSPPITSASVLSSSAGLNAAMPNASMNTTSFSVSTSTSSSWCGSCKRCVGLCSLCQLPVTGTLLAKRMNAHNDNEWRLSSYIYPIYIYANGTIFNKLLLNLQYSSSSLLN